MYCAEKKQEQHQKITIHSMAQFKWLFEWIIEFPHPWPKQHRLSGVRGNHQQGPPKIIKPSSSLCVYDNVAGRDEDTTGYRRRVCW